MCQKVNRDWVLDGLDRDAGRRPEPAVPDRKVFERPAVHQTSPLNMETRPACWTVVSPGGIRSAWSSGWSGSPSGVRAPLVLDVPLDEAAHPHLDGRSRPVAHRL